MTTVQYLRRLIAILRQNIAVLEADNRELRRIIARLAETRGTP